MMLKIIITIIAVLNLSTAIASHPTLTCMHKGISIKVTSPDSSFVQNNELWRIYTPNMLDATNIDNTLIVQDLVNKQYKVSYNIKCTSVL